MKTIRNHWTMRQSSRLAALIHRSSSISKSALICAICGLSFLVSASAQTANDPNEGCTLGDARVLTGGTSQTLHFKWWGRTGRTYFIQQSVDLMSWNWVPVIEAGNDSVKDWGFISTSDKLFVRLIFTDEYTNDPLNGDFDGDGVSNLEEVQQGSNPFDYYSQPTGIITPVITLASGDNQTSLADQFSAQPVVIQITNTASQPLNNAPIILTAVANVLISSTSNSSSLTNSLELRTSTQGQAIAYLWLQGEPGSRTVNISPKGYPAQITTASATVLAGVPVAPTHFTVSRNATNDVQLDWTDNATNETGYIISRSDDNGTTWTQVATVAANTTTYTLSAESAGSTSTLFKSQATNTSGSSSGSQANNAPSKPNPRYAIIDLSTGAQASVHYLNASGALIGQDSSGFYYWENGNKTRMPANFVPSGMNDYGVISGYYNNGSTYGCAAYSTKGQGVTILPGGVFTTFCSVGAVNNSGMIAYNITLDFPGIWYNLYSQPVYYYPTGIGVMMSGTILTINNSNSILVGFFHLNSEDYSDWGYYTYLNSTVISYAYHGSGDSYSGLNDDDVVIGNSSSGGFWWDGAKHQLGGAASSTIAINTRKKDGNPDYQILGSNGMLWEKRDNTGQVTSDYNQFSLKDLIHPDDGKSWVIALASCLNDSSLIGITATYSGTDSSIVAGNHTLLLVPMEFKLRNESDINEGWDPPLRGDADAQGKKDEDDWVAWTRVCKGSQSGFNRNELTKLVLPSDAVAQMFELAVADDSTSYIEINEANPGQPIALTQKETPITIIGKNTNPSDVDDATIVVRLKNDPNHTPVAKMKVKALPDLQPLQMKFYAVEDSRFLLDAPATNGVIYNGTKIRSSLGDSGAIYSETADRYRQAAIPFGLLENVETRNVPYLKNVYTTTSSGGIVEDTLDGDDNLWVAALFNRTSFPGGNIPVILVHRVNDALGIYVPEAKMYFISYDAWYPLYANGVQVYDWSSPKVFAPEDSLGGSFSLGRVGAHETGHKLRISTRHYPDEPNATGWHDPGKYPASTRSLMVRGGTPPGRWLRHEDWDNAAQNAYRLSQGLDEQ